jgi:endoglucanase
LPKIITHLKCSQIDIGVFLKILSYLILLLPHFVEAAPSITIAVNQIGYVSNWPKNAFLINSLMPDQEVSLIQDKTEIEVLKIKPGKQINAQNGVYIQKLDFTDVIKSGQYYLKQNDIKSGSFTINSFPFVDVYQTALRSYFLQRCGVSLADKSGLSHEACHLQDATIATTVDAALHGEHLQATGGWHDAGDFGKYIAPASATVNRLLSLYEDTPGLFTDGQLDIPESSNGVPDILDEVKFELEWMLTMQRQDGAVYRKLSGAHWPNVGSPDLDDQPRFVYGVSSPETAKFASSLAMAARVYKAIDSESAARYLKAAEKAWGWLANLQTQYIDIQPGDDTGSGKYLLSQIDQEPALKTDVDDKLAAAIELYLSTHNSEYEAYIEENMLDITYTLYEWKDITALSFYHLMQQDSNPDFSNIRRRIRSALINRADKLLASNKSNPYGLASTRFIWGSNKMVAEEGITLVHAYIIKKDEAYLKAAVDQLDYLLGKNPLDVSYVSGFGDNSVRFPNHLHARSAKIALKGFMVGGPNSLGQDNITPKNLGALSYVDNDHAYASNEYAIDYNSAFIGLVVTLMTLTDQAKTQIKLGN